MTKITSRLYPILFVCFFIGSFCYAEGAQNETLDAKNLSNDLPQDLVLSIGEYKKNLSKNDMMKWLNESTFLEYSPGYSSEIENPDFCEYKKSIVCQLSFDAKKAYHIQKKSSWTLNEESVKKYVEDLARQVNKDPENAKLKVENGKVSVFSLSNKGLELDQEKSTEVLVAYIKSGTYDNSINLPYKELDPEVNIDSIENMGITSLLGEGRSNFVGSPKNRIFNIKVATSRYNGLLIKPGEEFSFVKILGEVDGDHGYLPELVIKNDKTEPEFGGGICQVSTTAFRAAVNAGLKVTARRNHAYAVSYYNPPGMDATIYVPRPDLRFVNNTPGYILVQTKIEGTVLVFDFYGTDDGRKVEVTGPKILERNPDGSMKTTFNQRVTDKNGDVLIDDDFNSNYDSPSKYPHPGDTPPKKKKH